MSTSRRQESVAGPRPTVTASSISYPAYTERNLKKPHGPTSPPLAEMPKDPFTDSDHYHEDETTISGPKWQSYWERGERRISRYQSNINRPRSASFGLLRSNHVLSLWPWVARTRAILIHSHVFYKINFVLACEKNPANPTIGMDQDWFGVLMQAGTSRL
ncbi:hypothetical protein LTS15_000838 [Exophiala xenobiotica]|nr:hypothetical protein LTS15_000838 [Exophiala xenobiotica]